MGIGKFTSTSLSNDTRSILTGTRSSSSVIENSSDPEEQIQNYKELHRLFLEHSKELLSYGVVEQSGSTSISTTSGATITSENFVAALKARDERRNEKVQQQ